MESARARTWSAGYVSASASMASSGVGARQLATVMDRIDDADLL